MRKMWIIFRRITTTYSRSVALAFSFNSTLHHRQSTTVLSCRGGPHFIDRCLMPDMCLPVSGRNIETQTGNRQPRQSNLRSKIRDLLVASTSSSESCETGRPRQVRASQIIGKAVLWWGWKLAIGRRTAAGMIALVPLTPRRYFYATFIASEIVC